MELMKSHFAFVMTFLGVALAAQSAAPAMERLHPAAQEQQSVEVTQHDFVSLPKIVSTNLATFGVRLGMSTQEATAALQGFSPRISTKFDGAEELNVTVQNDNWPAVWVYFAQGKVDRIEWGSKMQQYLVGQSQKLLSPEAFSKDSALRLELLGREDNATPATDGTASLSVSKLTFVYGKEGLRLTQTVIQGPSRTVTDFGISLTKPARSR